MNAEHLVPFGNLGNKNFLSRIRHGLHYRKTAGRTTGNWLVQKGSVKNGMRTFNPYRELGKNALAFSCVVCKNDHRFGTNII